MGLVLVIVSGCGPSEERTNKEPNAVATNPPVSRSKPKRVAGNSEPVRESEVEAQTNPSTSSPLLQSISSADLEVTKTMANSGDAKAQAALGNYYVNGQAGRIDLPEAAKWYRAAAEQGEARAQYQLASMYAEGRGVARDDREAAKWFHLAAQQGDRMAQYSIGDRKSVV